MPFADVIAGSSRACLPLLLGSMLLTSCAASPQGDAAATVSPPPVSPATPAAPTAAPGELLASQDPLANYTRTVAQQLLTLAAQQGEDPAAFEDEARAPQALRDLFTQPRPWNQAARSLSAIAPTSPTGSGLLIDGVPIGDGDINPTDGVTVEAAAQGRVCRVMMSPDALLASEDGFKPDCS